ncbi:unnamed protein product [Caenorhabditis auriculariae]|uniref:SXP/RAL-2 family protein Ani s 5-like cation-binding domain-containing protein n=1 Tax=Caenorhabditis auriculariae TaxID=2777116 RepID=A0A8S1H7C2_9PELO|nr:unnamed protein product [Caenorhabditis auriculariae]
MFSSFKILALAALVAVVVCEEQFDEEKVKAQLVKDMKEAGVSEETILGVEKVAAPFKAQIKEARTKNDEKAGKDAFEKMSAAVDAYVAKASKEDQAAFKKFVEKIKAEYDAHAREHELAGVPEHH